MKDMKKLFNKKGFTLAELLIVVAIIAVLVAIAIPVFSGAVEKAGVSTDAANIRAAYASLQIKAIDPSIIDAEADAALTFVAQSDATIGTKTLTAGGKTVNLPCTVTVSPSATTLDKGATYTASSASAGAITLTKG